MTITAQEHALLDQRNLMDNRERYVLQSTLDHLQAISTTLCMPVANDDRMAKLEAAMIQFIVSSRTDYCNKH